MPKINKEEYEKIKLLPDYDWNWITREKTGKILSFTNKPTKTDEVWKDKQTRLWFNYKDSQLFQFIQWEDEEPYEIAELIREYEIKELRLAPSGTVIVDSFDESEETEVKDIEELKSWFEDDKLYVGEYVKHKIDQLDEPEVLSQEWIDEHKVARVNNLRKMTMSDVVPVDELQDLLVPKQEEVKKAQIPEWIVEWYQGANSEYSKLEDVFDNLSHDIDYNIIDSEKFRDRIMEYGGYSRMREALAHIYFGAYETEEEQKYYVSVRDEEYGGFWFLTKNKNGDISIGVGRDCSEVNWDRSKLTEQEIRDYDGRYWTFAVPVEVAE